MDSSFIEHEEEVASGNTCDVCGKHFSTMSNLRRHMAIYSADTSYECDVCDQEFTNKLYLTIHMRRHTTDETSYRCPHFGKEYNTIDGLNSHIRFKHNKTGKLCDTCKKDFKDTYALNRHMKNHSDEREVHIQCHGKFKDIKSHMVSCKAKKTKKYQCDHCDKMFSEKRYALIHKKGRILTQRGMPVIAEKHTLVHMD
jgi:KRAB domain-containing zinc finger protein